MSDILKRILGQNWPFYTHRRLYDMVRTEAAGAGVLSDTGQAWAEFTELMLDSRRRVDELLRKAGASWEGLAGEAMRGGVTPLAQWAEDAGTAGKASGGGLEQVGTSFAHTANAMPEPVEVSADPGFVAKYVHLFGGLTDQDQQTRMAHEAKRRAVELMNQYSANAHSAVASLGVFVPPQEVAVGSGPFAPRGGGGVRYGGEAIVAGPPGAERGPAGAGNGHDPTPEGAATARRSGEPAEWEPAPGTNVAATAGSTTPAADTPGQQGGGGSGAAGGAPSRGGFQAMPLGERLGGPPAPRLGAGHGGGGRYEDGAQRAAGARVAARVGAMGTGPAMVPAAASRREEDKEHVSPEYLRGDHDELWAAPTVSPPVLGEDGPTEG